MTGNYLQYAPQAFGQFANWVNPYFGGYNQVATQRFGNVNPGNYYANTPVWQQSPFFTSHNNVDMFAYGNNTTLDWNQEYDVSDWNFMPDLGAPYGEIGPGGGFKFYDEYDPSLGNIDFGSSEDRLALYPDSRLAYWDDSQAPFDGDLDLNLDNIQGLLSNLTTNKDGILGSVRDSIQRGIKDTFDLGQSIRGDVYAQLKDAGIHYKDDNPFAGLESLFNGNDQTFAQIGDERIMVGDDGDYTYTKDLGDDGYISLSGSGNSTDFAGMSNELNSLLNTLGNSFGGSLLGNLGDLGQRV